MKPFYLGGDWVQTNQSEIIVNPWSGDTIAEICLPASQEIEMALQKAVQAFQKTRYSSAEDRSSLLAKIADLIHVRREELAKCIVAEAGKPINFAEAEVERARMTFRFASALALADEGHVIAMDASAPGRGHFGVVRRFPIGIILGITPFNFPLNLVAHKVAPCLATGNTMILKPALKTPLTSLLLAEILHEAGMPAGQNQSVLPFRHDHVPRLLEDPRIRMLSFTGGVDVGWKLKTLASKIKVALELGGDAAVVVEPDAEWHQAIPEIVSAAFSFAGQSCISVQRILVHRSIANDFRKALINSISEIAKVGNPADKKTMLGPMISSSAREKILTWIHAAQSAGAHLLTPLICDGESVLHPVLLENVPASCSISCEEAFAPVALLESYDSFDEAITMVNNSRFGLQAGIFTSNISKALKAFTSLDVGGVMVNEVPTFRVENMPYGGIKDSGYGREGIRYAMEEMTEPRSFVTGGL